MTSVGPGVARFDSDGARPPGVLCSVFEVASSCTPEKRSAQDRRAGCDTGARSLCALIKREPTMRKRNS